jgi:hypothetical protein
VLVDTVLTAWARPAASADGTGVVDLEIGIEDAAGAAPVTGTARVRTPPTG